tara:strand:- start:41 stop:586 length:546 start_codon:yes stop_codon:yes gene_type:complete
MVQAAIVLVVVALLTGAGFITGKKWERSVWQPVYGHLAAQLTKLQSDLNIKNAEALGASATKLAEITVYGKVSEVKNEFAQKEIDRRVDAYLNNLSNNGLLLSAEERDSGESGSSDPLSSSARKSYKRSGQDGLFIGLDRLEKGVIERLARSRDKALARNLQCKEYLDELEVKMNSLRTQQ